MSAKEGKSAAGAHHPPARLSTGIRGLDEILGGGLPPNRLYLIQGDPGTGKTTLAMQFLMAGVARGEPGLYVALSETREELASIAAAHGWNLDGIRIFEMQPTEHALGGEQEYTTFHPSEVELSETVQTLIRELERAQPRRVAIDSLSEMRLLARDPFRYRRQMLALKEFLVKRNCTILVLDDPASKVGDHQFQTLAHGVVLLERESPEYGREKRKLHVVKLRGIDFDGGFHDFRIHPGGLEVFPRMAPGGGRPDITSFDTLEQVSSGVPEFDGLLGGGPERGSAMLLMGAAGTGKSSLAFQYAMAACRRGQKSAAFIFDERMHTLLARTKGLGMDLDDCIRAKLLEIHQIDPAALTAGEFVEFVRASVENSGARVVIIDSLNGYLNAMPGEKFLLVQMHELLTYLASKGVLTVMVVAQHGLVAASNSSSIDLSYLADTVLLLRYFEHAGRVRKAISVMKKRAGKHEDTIREFRLDSSGIRVGQPLMEFQGVLQGMPTYHGPTGPLIKGHLNQLHGETDPT
jgi:circadian clock protein KaiC